MAPEIEKDRPCRVRIRTNADGSLRLEIDGDCSEKAKTAIERSLAFAFDQLHDPAWGNNPTLKEKADFETLRDAIEAILRKAKPR